MLSLHGKATFNNNKIELVFQMYPYTKMYHSLTYLYRNLLIPVIDGNVKHNDITTFLSVPVVHFCQEHACEYGYYN